MTMLYELPSVLKNHIYEYDDTYRLKYNEVMEEIENSTINTLRRLLDDYEIVEDDVENVKQVEDKFLVTMKNGGKKWCWVKYPWDKIKDEIIKARLCDCDPKTIANYTVLSWKSIAVIQTLDYELCNEELYKLLTSDGDYQILTQFTEEVWGTKTYFNYYYQIDDLYWDLAWEFEDAEITLLFRDIDEDSNCNW